jgi:hypothetical protein
MSDFDPELIVMPATSAEADPKMIEAIMGEVLMMVHA